MTKQERQELIKEAQEMGLKSITIKGVKYELAETTSTAPKQLDEKETESLAKELIKNPFSDMTDDEILYYATPYYDQLQQNKKLLEQQKKDKGTLTNG